MRLSSDNNFVPCFFVDICLHLHFTILYTNKCTLQLDIAFKFHTQKPSICFRAGPKMSEPHFVSIISGTAEAVSEDLCII